MQRASWCSIRSRALTAGAFVLLTASAARADVKLPNIFGDHMVLQQKQKNRVWGLAEAGEAVSVAIDQQRHQATAGADGKWQIALDPLHSGGPFTLTADGEFSIGGLSPGPKVVRVEPLDDADTDSFFDASRTWSIPPAM